MKLHFQVSPDDHWQSPQIPEDCLWLPEFLPQDDPGILQRREILREVQTGCVSYDALAAKVTDALVRDIACECMGTAADAIRAGQSPGESVPGDPGQDAQECLKKGGKWFRDRNAQTPTEVCEPVRRALWNLGQPSAGMGEEGEVGVQYSNMTPVWLECAGNPYHHLAFVRYAEVEGTRYYQGFLADWETLRDELLEEISGLFPSARLEPVDDAAGTDRNRPMLLPVAALITGPPSWLQWSWTHAMLILVWTVALAMLGGVGMGLRSVLTLAERRTQFAYAVTHELRTPLTTLRLYTDMLAAGMVKKDDLETYYHILDAEAERLSDMVNNVLEYARVENQAVKLDLQSMTVSDLLNCIDEHCAARCDSAGKKLVVDANGIGSTELTTDPQLVRQVIANLVDNACKYTRDAQDPAITIRAVGHHGDKLSLDVEDYGPGITSADRQTIFKPFRRGRDSGTRKSGGIGLGLALARSWSRLLDGNLELLTDHSRPDGTCFRLTIPRKHR